MKLLGRGWQYSTYDLGNGRVLKKYNSVPTGYWHVFKTCFPFNNDRVWKIPEFYRGCKETALDSIKKLPNVPLESWMMGNPKVLNALDYEQDKLLPLHDHFEIVDSEVGKRTIDAFVQFNRLLVNNSIIDKSFNITKNFALDAQGRVVLMDIGEVYTSSVSIDKQIRERVWTAYYTVDPLPVPLRDYFVESMDREFLVK